MTRLLEPGPIFLVGVPRSGTTLLQRMLDAHPQVAIAPETFFVRKFGERRKHYGRLDDARHRTKLLRDLTALPEFAEMGLDAADFTARLVDRDLEYEDVFAELLDAYRRKRNKPQVGEKTPNHLLAMQRLEGWFPNARFVHIVRDPRAVTESWRNVPFTNGSLETDAEVWRRYLETSRKARPLHAPYVEVRYENLLANPEAELRRMCTAIHLDFDWAMLAYHEVAPVGIDIEREPWKAEALKPLKRTAGERESWRERLTASEITRIESVVWFEMRQKDYRPATPLHRLLPLAVKQALERRRARNAKRLASKGSEDS